MTRERFGDPRAVTLCGAALVVLLAALPGAMSLSTSRGFVLPKFAIGMPLAALAALAAVWIASTGDALTRRSLRPDVAGLVASGLLACVALSASQADAWQVSWLGGYFRLEGALSWLAYLAAFFATRAWIVAGGTPIALIDAMLVASIAPAIYAIEQRFGLEFVNYAFGDPSRSAGTMGNPMFLGAYLAMCIPMSLVRQRMAVTAPLMRAGWWLLVMLQAGGLFATGSRGALVGLIAGLAFLIGARGARSWIVASTGAMVMLAGFLAFINFSDAGRTFARGVAPFSRLVYDTLGRDPATRSIRGRLAAWSAGETAMREAPTWRLLTGWGPDVAHERYYAHMPVEKIRAEDFRSEQVVDRVHADLIDTTAALGVIGSAAIVMLFGMALRRAGQVVLGRTQKSVGVTVAAGIGGMAGAWLLGDLLGTGAARWPLAGAGLVAGWLFAIWVLAWRSGGRAEEVEVLPDERAVMTCAGAALVVFWLDAQIGLPVFSTRIGFFVLMAIALTTGPGPQAVARDSGAGCGAHAGAAFTAACGVAFLGFVPAFGMGRDAGLASPILAQALPVAGLLLLGRLAGAGRQASNRSCRPVRELAALVGLALIAVGRYGVSLPASEVDWLSARSVVECLLPLLLWSLPFVFAARAALPGWGQRGVPGALPFITCALAMSVTAWPIWRLTEGNVARSAATLLETRDVPSRIGLLRATMEAVPWEWQYRYALVFEALPAASEAILSDKVTSEGIADFIRLTGLAEEVARGGLLPGSPDPWRPFLLGIVLQARSQSALARIEPDGGVRASAEADAALDEAHRLYPVQPLILEHWVVLKIDRGEIQGALALVDRMEALIPEEPEPYVLRVKIGKRFGLPEEVRRGLETARKSLQVRELRQVLDVVN